MKQNKTKKTAASVGKISKTFDIQLIESGFHQPGSDQLLKK